MSGLGVVWRVGWGLCGEWVESCVESGLRVVLRMGWGLCWEWVGGCMKRRETREHPVIKGLSPGNPPTCSVNYPQRPGLFTIHTSIKGIPNPFTGHRRARTAKRRWGDATTALSCWPACSAWPRPCPNPRRRRRGRRWRGRRRQLQEICRRRGGGGRQFGGSNGIDVQ